MTGRKKSQALAATLPGSQDAAPIFVAGGILFADVIAFSKRDPEQQVACVKRLSEWIEGDEWFRELSREHWYVNGTGDGFVIVVGDRAAPKLITQMVLMAARLRDLVADLRERPDVAEELQDFGLRLGVHAGNFSFYDGIFGQRHAIGSGVNMAQRVMSWSADGEITVSEAAVEQAGPSLRAAGVELFPDPPAAPFEVGIKHGETMQFRLVPPPSDGASRPNARMLELERVNAMLCRVLDEIGSLVDNHICRQNRITLTTPMSVKVPGRPGEHAVALKRSFCRQHAKPTQIASGGSAHMLGGSVRGPVVRAYEDKVAVRVVGLPDWNKSHDRYISKFMSQDRSMTVATLREWHSHPRALLELPVFAYPDTHGDPGSTPSTEANPVVAVLGLDFSVPLSKSQLERLQEVEQWLVSGTAMSVLSLAWQLRTRV